MSRSTLYVRFPDGTVRYGIINGTVEVVVPPLFDTANEAWDHWQDYGNERHTVDPYTFDPAGAVDVEVADDWSWWPAKATRTHIVTNLRPMDDLAEDEYHSEPPPWLP